MKKFDKYVFFLFLKYFILVSLFVLLMSWISAALGVRDRMEPYNYTIDEFFKLSTHMVLITLNVVIPIIVTVATIITVLMIMRSNECLAYMTIGGSIFRLIVPFLSVGFFVMVFMVFVDDKVIPYARYERAFLIDKIESGGTFQGYVNRKNFTNSWFIGKDRVIQHIGWLDMDNKEIYEIIEYELLENNVVKSVRNIDVIYKSENGDWVAKNMTLKEVASNPPKVTSMSEEVYNNPLWDKLLSVSTNYTKALTPDDLRTIISILKSKGAKYSYYQMILYSKYAKVLSVAVLILFIFPVAINFGRNYSIMKNAGITFGYAITFIIVSTFGESLGKSGTLSPFMANFMPIILFITLSIFQIVRKNSNR